AVAPAVSFSTLSLHDALPIYRAAVSPLRPGRQGSECLSRSLSLPSDIRSLHSQSFRSREGLDLARPHGDDLREIVPTENGRDRQDRKSTRLNSSLLVISYAVF